MKWNAEDTFAWLRNKQYNVSYEDYLVGIHEATHHIITLFIFFIFVIGILELFILSYIYIIFIMAIMFFNDDIDQCWSSVGNL